MEQNLPIVTKKFWNIVRVIYFMLRKGIISKAKLLADLNTIMKRGKIVGKAAIHNLVMFHHHHIAAASGRRFHDRRPSFPADEYEFSCSNSPAFFHLPSFHLSKRSKKYPAHAPPSVDGDLVLAALEMMIGSVAASPALPGFGRTPMVRQLRITDSPFPLREVEEGNFHVDEAAEEFIVRFYKDLKRQNEKGYLGYS
ncbi:hypothetical protein CASFOL_024918 [Castilleja foliolosa]|uniref:Avr9/Cf-9 rapidly elicited protein 146 n=1 Tax=Castilleja foliolosa TaxID=1961234 RepID=A0ABD3CQX1_9LAMI